MTPPPAGAAWAPNASTVDLVLDGGERERLEATERAGWFAPAHDLVTGTRYRFSLDGAAPLPDPRSGWQPDGAHASSCVVDHESFTWGTSEASWHPPDSLLDAVIYELHVGTFTTDGTYSGAAAHLPHLRDLGVTHVELLPLATFAGHHGWGYDGVYLYAPHPAYGTPDELRTFVAACHEHGLAVLLDVVYNHLGPEGNYLGSYGPYFTDRYHTPWGAAVNLDGAGSDEVRRFLVDNALHWIQHYHVDGLRLDAVHALLDTGARHVLEQLSDEVRDLASSLGRPVVLVAENDTNDPRLVRPSARGGLGLDAHWCDDVHHVLHTALTGEQQGYYADFDGTLAGVGDGLAHGYVYRGRYSPTRDHHVGRIPTGLRGRQLVASLQNHDQIGNRARGDRIASLAGFDRARAGAALLLLGPFVPLLFQGEEWAASSPFPYFADHTDPDLVEAVRSGRRAEFAAFGWNADDVLDPESEATFRAAVLDWDEPTDAGSEHGRMLAWYRGLLTVRRDLRAAVGDRLALTGGADDDASAPVIDADDGAGTIVLRRGQLFVACNLSDQTVRLPAIGPAQLLLRSHPDVELEADELVLPAGATAVGITT